MALHSSAHHAKSAPHEAEGDSVSQSVRLVVLDFDPRWTVSTVDAYGDIGPGWIMGPESDYPVIFQEYAGKYRIEKFREEIAALGGSFALKPDLDESQDENPLLWREAGLVVPVAKSNEEADLVASVLQSISLAAEQSGLFTQGSLTGIRNPKAQSETVARENTKQLWRQKWRGSWRGGELIPSNKYG